MTGLIEAVFEQQADRAPDVAGLRAALARSTGKRRRAVLVPVLAGMVVVVCLGVTTTTVLGGSEDVESAGVATPSTRTVAMPYRLTEASGYGEAARGIDFTTGQWWRTYESTALPEVPITLRGLPVDGRPAPAGPTDDVVTWLATPGVGVETPAGQGAGGAGLVADLPRWFVADDTTSFVVPLEFGWLPDRLAPDTASVAAGRGGPGDPTAYLSSMVVPGAAPTGPTVAVQLGRQRIEGSGEPVTVRGRPGEVLAAVPGVRQRTATVQLEDGRWLEVAGDLATADLLHVADTLDVAPEAPAPWLGR